MKQFSRYFAILKITIKTIPFWSVYTILNSVLGVICDILGSVIIVNIVLTRISLNKSFAAIILPVLLIQLIILSGGICTSVYYGRIDPIARQKLKQRITSRLVNNMMTTEMKNLDNPDFLDEFTFSVDQIEQRTTGSIVLVSNLISNAVGLITSMAIVGFIHLEVIILVIFVVMISLIFSHALTRIQFKADHEMVLPTRKKSYVERTYHMKKFALEIRLYPVGQMLQNMYDAAVKDLMDIIHKYGFKIGVLAFIRAYNKEIILYWGSMSIILFKLFSGSMSIASVSVVPVTIAVYRLSNYILALTDVFSTLKEYELYSEKLLAFLHMTDNHQEKKAVDCTRMHDICFHNVSFQYHKNEKFSLKNVNLQFPTGAKVALVGFNGSGKSTIIKLLLGLYTDYSGEITIDNESISNFDMQGFRNLFSVVQQDFQHYPCTIAENVLMDSAVQTDVEKIKASLELVELNLNVSDDDLLTKPVTSEFCSNGLTLSKGQYQKLALARIFASDKNFIILDEPTSALDPIAEYKVFNRLLEHFHQKTVVIISHRLTATKNADMIYFIENGEIVESGNHQQLMESGGKYAEMYSLQAEKYL